MTKTFHFGFKTYKFYFFRFKAKNQIRIKNQTFKINNDQSEKKNNLEIIGAKIYKTHKLANRT